MGIKLTKDSIDLGIVVSDPERALAFYRDLLGFEPAGDGPMPGMHMYRLMCGTSMIKLCHPKRPPAASAPSGGIVGATGYRYWTISVADIDELTDRCAAEGFTVAVPVTEIMPGTRIAIVEDPDGNWVEFLSRADG